MSGATRADTTLGATAAHYRRAILAALAPDEAIAGKPLALRLIADEDAVDWAALYEALDAMFNVGELALVGRTTVDNCSALLYRLGRGDDPPLREQVATWIMPYLDNPGE